jgi:hypothetical protein
MGGNSSRYVGERYEDIKEEVKAKIDPVNHPAHYTGGLIECIDAIEAALTPEEFRGFCKGNAFKYVWRERMKGAEVDIAKALFYLRRLNK